LDLIANIFHPTSVRFDSVRYVTNDILVRSLHNSFSAGLLIDLIKAHLLRNQLHASLKCLPYCIKASKNEVCLITFSRPT